MSISLQQKFSDPTRGVYFVGTTPPRDNTEPEKVIDIADKLLARLRQIDYDGLIIYDIQDESSRISKPRPFPYMRTLDPREYSQLLRKHSSHAVITYKSVAQRDRADFEHWLEESRTRYDVQNLVLVGSPSSDGDIQLTLPNAYKALQEHPLDFHLGGVTIAERHASKGNEHLRLLTKTEQGCQFFITQAVYNAQATIDLLSSYARECHNRGVAPQRIILTFTPCGSAKTLEFMEWLGISVPDATRWRILDSAHPLAESIRVCRSNLDLILDSVANLGIPLGLNIESLTNRKDEIDASIRLFKLLKATLDLKLAEQQL